MNVLSLRLLSFLCCLLLIIFFTSQAAAYDSLSSHYCIENRGNYTANSTYHRNLNTLLSTLTSHTEIDYGFYNFSYGKNGDKVNAIGLCRGDVKSDECRSCLKYYVANLTEFCPNQKEAIGWYDNERCMLRYSDRTIFGIMEDSPFYHWISSHNATDVDQFNVVVRNLLDNLTSKAASGDSRLKYAAASAPGPNFQTIYGLVQCTPDLSESQCNACLIQSMGRIGLDCCRTLTGNRIVRPSCNLRFETSAIFYNSTAPAPPPPPPPLSTTTTISSQGKSNKTVVVAVTVAVVVAVMAIFICIYLGVRKQRKKFETQTKDDDDDEIEIFESLQFNFNTIQDATNGFSNSNKLGQGGFGDVYKGRLLNGQEIAVKRLSKDSSQGDLEFKNEVLLMAKLQHRNLVRLLGFCLERRERLLIYEFVPNRSLDYIIFDKTKRAKLDWEKRYKIIEGIARGILYLHEDSRLRIIHRDLKASNILLDEEMNPKISDFGTARLFVVDQSQENTNRVVGTYGYMAPEYIMEGQFSVKSDVFSFGVLVLEIISGQKNNGIRHGENVEHLMSFAWRNWKNGSTINIIDPTLNNVSQNEIMRCIHIGLLCVQENVAARPTMNSIVLMLNSYSVTLHVPSEPAFYVDGRSENLPNMHTGEYNSTQASVNESSITEAIPR